MSGRSNETLRGLTLVPLRREAFRRELALVVEWHNKDRPHSGLQGRTPEKVYYRRFPANRRPRYEPREKWPLGSPWARPWVLARGKPGVPLEFDVAFHAGRRRLPVAKLRPAA